MTAYIPSHSRTTPKVIQTLIHILSQGLLQKFLTMIAMGRLFAFRPWKKFCYPVCFYMVCLPDFQKWKQSFTLGLLRRKNGLAKISTKWKTDAKIGRLVPQTPMAPSNGAHSCYSHPCSSGVLYQSNIVSCIRIFHHLSNQSANLSVSKLNRQCPESCSKTTGGWDLSPSYCKVASCKDSSKLCSL